MDAVIEITQLGASVTYVMRGPSVSPWHVTPDASQRQVESSGEPESQSKGELCPGADSQRRWPEVGFEEMCH